MATSHATTIDQVAARRIAEAQRQARGYESMARADGPGYSTRAHRFCALIVDGRVATMDGALAAAIEQVRPGLQCSGQPGEMWAHTVTLGDVHVAFLGSEVDFRDDGEYMIDPMPLPRYVLVEHDRRHRHDRFLEGIAGAIRVTDRDHQDHEAGPWEMLERRTGLTLAALQAAIPRTQPVWLVCRGLVVRPGVAQVRIPVRHRVAPRPRAPSLPALLERITDADVRVFEGELPAHACQLAAGGAATRRALVAMLGSRDTSVRHARLALATMARVGGPAAAAVIAPCLARPSKVVHAAARVALARLGEDARAAVVAAAASRQAAARTTGTVLVKLLDDPRYADLRRVRALRDAVPAAVRAELDDLVALDPRDLDWDQRDARRDELLSAGGPGAIAWFLARIQEHPGGTEDLALGVVSLLDGDPLAPWVVALILVEASIPGEAYGNYTNDARLIEHAVEVLGAPMKRVLAALCRAKLIATA